MFPDWDWTLIAVSASFHGVAILSTLFRLWYRWYTEHMGWDDAWAVLAFLADIACLTVTVLEQPIPGDPIPQFFTDGDWIFSIAYPTLMWAARISILASIVRVSCPEGVPRYVAVGVGASFGFMCIAMFAFRVQVCVTYWCFMTSPLLIAQTTTDCVADVLLSALPIWYLRRVKLNRQRKILISSALSASMVINVVTVIEAVVLLRCYPYFTSGSIIFEHVKLACSMIVCNLLVIVTFVYRVLHKGMGDPVAGTGKVEFTTVDPAHVEVSQEDSKEVPLSIPSGTIGSSTWSFHGNRSKASRSVATVTSQTDVEMNP